MSGNPASIPSRRTGPTDRRSRPTPAISRYLFRGRRRRARRSTEAGGGYYVDHPGLKALAAAGVLLTLTLLDAAFTLRLIEGGATEENPLMAHALSRSVAAFLLTKCLLTIPSIGVLLVHKNFPLLHPRFRVRWLILGCLGVYGTLVGYELALFSVVESSS